jgi:hypothetical protein
MSNAASLKTVRADVPISNPRITIKLVIAACATQIFGCEISVIPFCVILESFVNCPRSARMRIVIINVQDHALYLVGCSHPY